jgi:NADPH:quinone reductase
MREPRNRVVQFTRFGDPDGIEVVDAPLPTADRGEVRVRVLASSVQYTCVDPAPPLPANCGPPAAVRAGI